MVSIGEARENQRRFAVITARVCLIDAFDVTIRIVREPVSGTSFCVFFLFDADERAHVAMHFGLILVFTSISDAVLYVTYVDT